MELRTRSIAAGLSLGFALTLAAGCVPDSDRLAGHELDPERHRAQIVAIDAVLFEDGPLGAGARDQLAAALVALAAAAQSDLSNTFAVVHGKELRMLAVRVKQASAGTLLASSPLRQRWFQIRASLFSNAAWFRRSSADPIAAKNLPSR